MILVGSDFLKRIAIILVGLMLFLSLTACKSKNDESKININELSSDEVLLDVLNNKKKFIDESGKKVLLKDYKLGKKEVVDIFYADPQRYTILDIDGDKINELVVYISPEFGAYLVFHIWDDTVYGFEFWEREFIELKVNGSFVQSSGAGDNKYVKLSFDKNKYMIEEIAYIDEMSDEKVYRISGMTSTEEETKKIVDEFYNLENVEWISISEDLNNQDSVIDKGMLLVDGTYLYEEGDLSSKVIVEFLDENDNLILKNQDIEKVFAKYSDWSTYHIQLKLTNEGGSKFEVATKENIGKTIRIMVNGEVLIAPIIQEPISGNEIAVSNCSSYEEMMEIYKILTE